MKFDAIEKFLERVRRSLCDDSFVLLRLRPATGPDMEGRLVTVKTGRVLSLSSRRGRQMDTRNLEIADGLKEISGCITPGGTAWLETTTKNLQLVAPPDGRARLVEHKTVKAAPPSREHDRAKRSHLDGAHDWLAALGLADADGRPLHSSRDKLRQIERYADLLSHFASDCGWKPGDHITLADMGCGKGYLTFAAWHLLRRKLRLDATLIGLDAQPAIIATCEDVAKKISAEKISFRTGTIEAAELPPLDALIALHACNDATDSAIRRGIEAGAKLILVAPCCHKDIRRALGAPEPLAPLLEHGLLKERFAEWLTDGLRVLTLEAAGYRVKTAEFVPAEHTPKNLMIAAIRGNAPARRTAAAAQLAAIKTWAGLDHFQ